MFKAWKKKKTIEGNIIKNVRNRFRLKKRKKKKKKETNHTTIKDRNIFRLKKRNKAIKDRTITNIRNFFKHE